MKYAIIILFALASTCANAESPLVVAMGNAAKTFENCFYDSVAAQLKASRTTDYNMVSENSFVACSTEETAMAFLLKSAGISREDATMLLTSKRIALKQTIRNIAANPARYR